MVLLLPLLLTVIVLAVSSDAAQGSASARKRVIVERENGQVVDRMAAKDRKFRWPRGRIPFQMDQSVEGARWAIEHAIKFWNDNTCVKIYEDKNVDENKRHVYVESFEGCNAIVGYNQSLPHVDQAMSIQIPGCDWPGIVAHEFGHSIGLWHEHMRPDVSTYFNYFPQNVGDDDVFNFHSLDHASIDTFGLPYDYRSIMQYPADGMSANGRLVLVPRDPLAIALMGNTLEPTFQDYKTVNLMYRCTNKCKKTKCSNGGYGSRIRRKGCRCMCPEGWEGPTCERASSRGQPCLFNVTTAPFRIVTPSDPQPEGPFVDCAWLITPPPGKQVQITFTERFQLVPRLNDANPNSWKYLSCEADYLRIRTGDLLSDDPGDMHCWTELANKVFTTTSQQTLLHFHTSFVDFARYLEANVDFV